MSGPLLKRAGGPAAVATMAPADVLRQAEVTLECQSDPELAGLLADRITKAVQAGEWSFPAPKLAALVALADAFRKGATAEGRDALRKALREARQAPSDVLAPDFAARAHVVAQMARVATTDQERSVAKHHVDVLAGDIRADVELRKIFAAGPRRMGVAP